MRLLFGVIGYMAFVQPQIALISLALLVPQIILAPTMQRRLNKLVALRLTLLRDLGDKITNSDADLESDMAAEAGGEAQPDDEARVIVLSHEVYANRIRFMFWKLMMKSLLNLLNALAPVSVLIWGGWLAINGETTVGVLVAFLAGFEKLSGPIRGLISFYRTAAQAEVQHCMIAKWM